MKLKLIGLALLASASASFAASTLNVRNFSSASVGVPIVDAAGASLAVDTFYANGGYFTTPLDFGTATFATIASSFVGIDASPVGGGTRSGLFTAQTYNGALPADFAGKNAYVVIANNANFALATLFAVFDAKTTFTAPDSFGNSAQTLDAVSTANVVFGTVRGVTGQPSGLNGAAFTSGVQLVASQIPEPTTALLGAFGALGLLRRRRN